MDIWKFSFIFFIVIVGCQGECPSCQNGGSVLTGSSCSCVCPRKFTGDVCQFEKNVALNKPVSINFMPIDSCNITDGLNDSCEYTYLDQAIVTIDLQAVYVVHKIVVLGANVLISQVSTCLRNGMCKVSCDPVEHGDLTVCDCGSDVKTRLVSVIITSANSICEIMVEGQFVQINKQEATFKWFISAYNGIDPIFSVAADHQFDCALLCVQNVQCRYFIWSRDVCYLSSQDRTSYKLLQYSLE